MAKKEIRLITASDEVRSLVDQGAKVNTELGNLTMQDKGIKAKLVEHVSTAFLDGETSVRVDAETARAMVTAVEKATLNTGAERFPEVKQAVAEGFLPGIVERSRSLVIPPDDM